VSHAVGGPGTLRLRALLLLLVLCAPLAATAANERALKEAELNRLRQHIADLRSEMGEVRTRHDQLRARLRSTEEAIGRHTRRIRALEKELAGHRRRLVELEQEQGRLESDLREQRKRLAQQITAAYASGRQESLKILLNQEDPATLGRVMAYYDYLNRARSRRIRALTETFERLQAVRREQADATAAVATARDKQLAQRNKLQAQRAERADVVARLREELDTKDERLARLLEDEKELERLILALVEALEDIPEAPGDLRPFPQLHGELRWPVTGRRLADYGSRRKNSEGRWQGVVIAAAEGSEVRAISHGRVAFADWLRGYGLLAIIDHGEGYMSLYGRNQSLYAEAGDWVEAGDVIAAAGNSGGSTRHALYFEIRHNGKPTNPARWCRLAAADG